MEKDLDIKKVRIQHLTDSGQTVEFIDMQTKIALKMQKELAEKEDNIIRDALISND